MRLPLTQLIIAVAVGVVIYQIGGLNTTPLSAIGQATVDCNAVTEIPTAECVDLVALFDGTDGTGWYISTDWGVTETPCSWYGVTCTDGRVTSLNLQSNGLMGPLPELNAITELQGLYLQNNLLSGALPDLSGLVNLKYLYLSRNRLTGSIPALDTLVSLEDVYLNENRLTGSIPSLSTLTNLQTLWLHTNKLSGPIPDLSNLSALGSLWLHSNKLSGPVPDEACGLSQLYLRYNALDIRTNCMASPFGDAWIETQTVPPTNLSSTIDGHTALTLDWTPISYTNHSGYYQVLASFDGGDFTPVGQTTDKASSSYTLDSLVSAGTYEFAVRTFSSAHGTPGFGDYQQSSILSATSQPITVTLPTLCATVSEIPESECNALEALYWSTDGPNWNNRTGWRDTNTPCSWYGISCQGGHVTEIDLYNNQLDGTLPPLSDLPNLEALYLNSNRLSGTVPELSALTSFDTLYLNNNRFAGAVPDEACTLRELYLGYNSLTPRTDCAGSFREDGWADTQTVAPNDVVAIAYPDGSMGLTWTPITYTADGGAIDILQATSSDGPFTSIGQTASKSADSFDVTNLDVGTTYYYAVQVSTPAHGTAGSINYQPNDLHSTTSYPISATAFLNLPPVVADKTVNLAVDTDIVITLTGYDPEGQPITYTLVDLPSNGMLTSILNTDQALAAQSNIISATTNLLYTPNAGFIGMDSFTFVANDGVSESGLGTVNINVEAGTPTQIPSTPAPSTPTPVPTPQSTPTDVPSATPMDTPTAMPTATPTAVPTLVPTETPTPLETPTIEPTEEIASTPPVQETVTPQPTATGTLVVTPEATPTPAGTVEPTAEPIETPTAPPSATDVVQPEPTVTFIITPDATPVSLDPFADSDGDGWRNIDEDVNNDGFYINDDTDQDGTPNYLDPDDDDDGTPTLVESSGDINGNGIVDYLDQLVSEPNYPNFLPVVMRQ